VGGVGALSNGLVDSPGPPILPLLAAQPGPV
jgi:hypothetical protein